MNAVPTHQKTWPVKRIKNYILSIACLTTAHAYLQETKAVNLISLEGEHLFSSDVLYHHGGTLIAGRDNQVLFGGLIARMSEGLDSIEWAKKLSIDQTIVHPLRMRRLPNGNVLVALQDYAAGGNFLSGNILLQEWTRQGNVVWSRRYGTFLSERPLDVLLTRDGKILVTAETGYQNGNAILLMLLDAQGNLLRHKLFHRGFYNYALASCEAGDRFAFTGNVYFNQKNSAFVLVTDRDLNFVNAALLEDKQLQVNGLSLYWDSARAEIVTYAEHGSGFTVCARFDTSLTSLGTHEFATGRITYPMRLQQQQFVFDDQQKILYKSIGNALSATGLFSDMGDLRHLDVDPAAGRLYALGFRQHPQTLLENLVIGQFPLEAIQGNCGLVNYSKDHSGSSTLRFVPYQFYTDSIALYTAVPSDLKIQDVNLVMMEQCRETISNTDDGEGRGPLKIFPNPTSDVLVFEGAIPGHAWIILGTDGRVRISGTWHGARGRIDLSSLHAGIYFLQSGKNHLSLIIM
jgi:hypothetical protein